MSEVKCPMCGNAYDPWDGFDYEAAGAQFMESSGLRLVTILEDDGCDGFYATPLEPDYENPHVLGIVKFFSPEQAERMKAIVDADIHGFRLQISKMCAPGALEIAQIAKDPDREGFEELVNAELEAAGEAIVWLPTYAIMRIQDPTWDYRCRRPGSTRPLNTNG